MSVSPFYLLLSVYFLANSIAAWNAFWAGSAVLDGVSFSFQKGTIVLAWLMQLACLFFISLSYEAGKRFLVERLVSLGSVAGTLLCTLQVTFLFFSKYYGVNVAGDASVAEGVPAIRHIFTVLRPDILFFLVASQLESRRWFYVNSFVYALSMIMRGWMSGVFLVALLWACRVGKIRLFSSRGILFGFFCIGLIVVAPFLLEAKRAVRSGGDVYEAVSSVISGGYIDSLGRLGLYVSNRLEHIASVALLIENAHHFYHSYIEGKFSTYWLDGLPQLVFIKIVGGDFYGLHHYMVEYFFNVEPRAWATHPGIAGWLFVLQERVAFFLIYFMVFVMLGFSIAARYGGRRLYMLTACFSLVYFFHGWFWSYVNFLLYLGFFVVMLRIKGMPVRRIKKVEIM